MYTSYREIQIILRLFLASQFKPVQSITQPPTLLADWEGSLGTWYSLKTTYILFELP